MARQTGTGALYQQIVKQVLETAGYDCQSQVAVGEKPGGGVHRVDFVATRRDRTGETVLVSCKVQNTSGTAEEKLVYEVVKLLHTMKRDPSFTSGLIVLGGTGWTDSYVRWVRSGLAEYIPGCSRILILTTDELISRGFRP